MMKTVWTIAVAAALVGGASAQDDPQIADYTKKVLANAEIIATKGGFMGAVVKNAPYSGEEVNETTQTLSDGTRIHNETRTTVYRDSQGRVRRESPDAVTIWDPVENASYFLNPKDQTYRQMPLAVQFFAFSGKDGAGNVTMRMGGGAPAGAVAGGMIPAPPPLPPGSGSGFSTQMVLRTAKLAERGETESLGHQTVEGLPADGTRQVSTIEANAIGNDRPIQIVSERWYSPDLQIPLMTKHSDPRTGEEVFHLIDVTRGDPPANLFTLPANYQKLGNK